MPAPIALYSNLAVERLADLTLASIAIGSIPPSGVVRWVHNSGGGAADGTSRNTPFTTLAAALAVCSAGDVVLVKNGHAETLSTSGVTWSQSGVTVVGLGNGRNRPALTCGAAAVTALTISGANNRLKNVRIIQSASQTKAFAMIALTGADNIIEGNVLEHGNGAGDAIICTAAARSVIKDNTFLGVGTGGQVAIQVQQSLINGTIANNVFNYGVNLLKSAVVFASLGSNCSGTNILNNMCSGIKLKFLDIVGSIATNTTAGLCSGNRVGYGATLTLLSSATITPGDMAVMDQHEVDGKRIQPTVYGMVSIHPSSAINVHAAVVHT